MSFDSPEVSTRLYSAFVEDEISLVDDRLRIALGSKFEHNDYTGWEIQPNGRMLFMPRQGHSVWASVARAVRTPSRSDSDVSISLTVIPPTSALNPTPWPAVVTINGSEDFRSEELVAYEMGYRWGHSANAFLDLAGFYNIYDNLRTGRVTGLSSPQPLTGFMEVPIVATNDANGETYGVEVAAGWRPRNWWRLSTSYTYLRMILEHEFIEVDASSGYGESENLEGGSPRNQVYLRSSMDVGPQVEFDLGLRYVDELPSKEVDSYLDLDLRLGWMASDILELSLVGKSLLDKQHAEFSQPNFLRTLPSEVERSFYGAMVWRFR
jgi:iron complex outermembrane receptor protein